MNITDLSEASDLVLQGLVVFFLVVLVWREFRRWRRIETLKPQITTQCRGVREVPEGATCLYEAPLALGPDIQGDIRVKDHEMYINADMLTGDGRALLHLFRQPYLCVSMHDVESYGLRGNTIRLRMRGIRLDITIFIDDTKLAKKIYDILAPELDRVSTSSPRAA